MNSRVPPNHNETTEHGRSQPQAPLGQWLSNRLAPAPAQPAAPAPHYPQQPATPASVATQAAQSVEEIHRRLDAINSQIDQMAQRRPAAPAMAPQPAPNNLANQLNDAISRLDMRLSQMAPHPASPQIDARHAAVERAAGNVYRESPPLVPTGMDAAIAEISARRSDLTGAPRPAAPAPQRPVAPPPVYPSQPAYVTAPPAAPMMPAAPQVDLSGIEKQLNQLSSQMEALRTPDHLEQSIATFRGELSEIRKSLTEALPRRAIESLEGEIRTLADKIEKNRDNAADLSALSSIEAALNDIYKAVRNLTPAEQLAGYDAAIQNLSGKIDLLVRANPNSNIIEQLEEAIGALRSIAANVASNDAISRLNDHIHALAEKVDHLADNSSNGILVALENRIALLTTAMETRSQAPAADTNTLEHAIRALTERVERLSMPADGSAAMAQVEQRIAYLLERLESTSGVNHQASFGRIEENLMDVLRQLDQQRQHFAAMDRMGPVPDAMQPALVDTIRRELSDVRFSQTETDRRTQDSLEAVQSTLSHVVDRLSIIETDLRRVQVPPSPSAPPPAPPSPPQSFRAEPAAAIATPPAPPAYRPELPNPARAQSFAAQAAVMERPVETIRDEEAFAPTIPSPRIFPREPIDPNLPPDFPLEPGARNRADGFGQTAGPDLTYSEEETAGGGQSNFIAAARRAAQAAMEAPEQAEAKPSRISRLTQAARNAAAKATAKSETEPKIASSTGSKVRSVLVGVSVVVIVLGTFKMALALIDSDSPSAETAAKPAPVLTLPNPGPKAEAPATTFPAPKTDTALPMLTSPSAVQQQSFFPPTPQMPMSAPAPVAKSDVTGTVVASAAPAAVAAPTQMIPVKDKLPDAIGGNALRGAALRGDPTAAYEVASRFAEGKGVTANYDEAVKWYERASEGGIVPAMFRLGSILEKGLSGKKDIETARHYYMTAAERGHAKAMHNLAVLDADGGGKGPNYKSASVWFKKAAERGVADSQYNLAILYARGIGVEQNLAESFKWFSLAAAQGDADAGRKRDDVAKRLDQQSLAAAKLAIQTFVPEKQPDDAVNVAMPAGGWDSAPQASAAPAPAKKPAKSATKHTASAI